MTKPLLVLRYSSNRTEKKKILVCGLHTKNQKDTQAARGLSRHLCLLSRATWYVWQELHETAQWLNGSMAQTAMAHAQNAQLQTVRDNRQTRLQRVWDMYAQWNISRIEH